MDHHGRAQTQAGLLILRAIEKASSTRKRFDLASLSWLSRQDFRPVGMRPASSSLGAPLRTCRALSGQQVASFAISAQVRMCNVTLYTVCRHSLQCGEMSS